jgi:uncharacterized protein (DUF1810 family)
MNYPIENLKYIKMNRTYQYILSINEGSEFLTKSTLSEKLEKCQQMVITSKVFSSYDECYSKLHDLIYDLSSTESSITGTNFVVVTKINPLFGGSQDKSEYWSKFSLMRMYVADAEELKASKLKYCAVAQLNIAVADVDNSHLT